MNAEYDRSPGRFAQALRALLLCQTRFKSGMSPGDLAQMFVDEWGCSRATAYRHAAACIDVLGLDVVHGLDAQRERGLRRRSVFAYDGGERIGKLRHDTDAQ